VLLNLVRAHHAATDSRWSGALLDDWGRAVERFWQVVPKEMLGRLAHPIDDSLSVIAAE
jgi:glutamate synthase (NADPH/NADH) large chain